MMFPYGGGAFGWGGAFMGFFGLLVIVGIVLLIVWAARSGEHQHMHAGGPYYRLPQQPPGGGYPQRDPAVDVARERYARGEITKEQLDEIMRTLGYSPPAPPPNPPAAT